VEENIAFPLRVRRMDAAETSRRVRDAAAKLGLERLLDRRPRALSGGERQRVALARAIVRQPNVFLMDEPLSNLDAQLRLETRAELKRLQHELGVTTVYVTHDQAEAMTLAHRVAVLAGGVLQQLDTPINVYNQPANLFVAGFLGSPPMNLLEGRVAPQGILVDEILWPLPEAALDRLQGRSQVVMGVRPEHVRLASGPMAGAAPARVYVVEPAGSESLVVVRLSRSTLTARVPAGVNLDYDQAVWAQVNPERLLFFDPASRKAI
jgi:multiple sugar transport system ATP-binding protein